MRSRGVSHASVCPPRRPRSLASLRRDLDANIDTLRRSAKGLVPDAVVDGLRRSVDLKLERLDRRFVAATKRRETDAMRSIATARGALFPHGVRQERKLASAPFLARYGPALIEQMLEAAEAHARSLVAGGPALATPPSAVTAAV